MAAAEALGSLAEAFPHHTPADLAAAATAVGASGGGASGGSGAGPSCSAMAAAPLPCTGEAPGSCGGGRGGGGVDSVSLMFEGVDLLKVLDTGKLLLATGEQVGGAGDEVRLHAQGGPGPLRPHGAAACERAVWCARRSAYGARRMTYSAQRMACGWSVARARDAWRVAHGARHAAQHAARCNTWRPTCLAWRGLARMPPYATPCRNGRTCRHCVSLAAQTQQASAPPIGWSGSAPQSSSSWVRPARPRSFGNLHAAVDWIISSSCSNRNATSRAEGVCA